MKRVSGRIRVFIDRNNLFDDSFKQIMKISRYYLKNTLRIYYIGETGIDAGGLLR